MREFADLRANLSPAMTFEIAGQQIGVRIDQMDSVALADRLWPVPFTRDDYVGLLDHNDALIPVMRLGNTQTETTKQLVAILHVRGEPMGLAIDKAGRLCDNYWIENTDDSAPDALLETGAQLARTSESSFWLLDADHLWQTDKPSASTATPD